MEARYLTDLEWRICHAVNIYVFRNGRDGEQPILVHIPPAKKKNMRTVMNVVQDRVKYPVGYAKYLFKMDGTRVKDPCELEMYNNYVVASNFEKHFKCAQYGRRRSPLLVLNRESKHVRVLKLQNQNYYEWLLKKKAVGEERPAYIYPPYYTNQNKLPQDLPLGQMGNYNPGEVHAPGCCYPKVQGGRTYRLDPSDRNYVVNTVAVDIPPPDLRSMPDFRFKRKPKDDPMGGNKYGPRNGKILEPTPSDMVNANLLVSDGLSQEAVAVSTTSETDDQSRRKQHVEKHHQHNSRSKNKCKPTPVHMVSSEEYHHRQQHHPQHESNRRMNAKQIESLTSESSTVCTQTSEEVMRKPKTHAHSGSHHQHDDDLSQTKSSRSKHYQVNRDELEPTIHQQTFMEFGLPPPPPAQFRDNMGEDINNDNVTLAQMRLLPPPPQFKAENQEISQEGRAFPKSFYYSPEKLAEINAAGNIQPLELAFTASPQPVHAVAPQSSTLPHSQWTIVHNQPEMQQQQQPLVQQVYAIESQPGGPGTPTTTTLIDASGVIGSYALTPGPVAQQQNQMHTAPQIMQSLTIPQATGTMIPGAPPSHNSSPTAQCIVIPTQGIGNPPAIGTTQLFAVPNTSSQSHLQQVYQLGIVQQPNPQNCIQVDAKAMRQYVDNQKLIECRFRHQQVQQHQQHQGMDEDRIHNIGHCRQQYQQQNHVNTRGGDLGENEVDIPFTPMKTYRVENPPNMTQSRSSEGRNSSMHRHNGLPNVKSRNVAIQMGYPASARSNRTVNEFMESLRSRNGGNELGGVGGKLSRASDISLLLNSPRHAINGNRSRSDSMANIVNLSPSFSNLMRMPRSERERVFLSNTTIGGGGGEHSIRRSGNLCSRYSDQYLGLHSGRNLAHSPPSQLNNNRDNIYTITNNNPFRRRSSFDPLLEELVTIPPPTEFRSYPLHSTKHQHDHQLDNSNSRCSNNFKHNMFVSDSIKCSNSPERCMYPCTNNNNNRSQYMHNQYI